MLQLNTSLTPPLFIQVPVPSHESERYNLCVRAMESDRFLRFFDWIWELFRRCDIFAVHFITTIFQLD